MATTFNKSIQEDFGGIFGIARNIEAGSNRRINVISRFADVGEDHPAVENYDDINMHLMNLYCTRDSVLPGAGNRYLFSANVTDGQNVDGFGVFDRYVFAGAFEERVTGNVFTYSNIDGQDTDGYMMIPQPYNVGGISILTQSVANMNSIRLTIQSQRAGGIPANTFIPLFGYTLTHRGEAGAYLTQNQDGDYYRNRYRWRYTITNHNYSSESEIATTTNTYNYALGCDMPTMIANSVDSIYGSTIGIHSSVYSHLSESPFQNDATRNSLVWFMYAHDGAGNGMLAMVPGDFPAETGSSALETYLRFRPYNTQYGVKNGWMVWAQPRFFDNYLSNNTLSQLWDYVAPGGEWESAIGKSGWAPAKANFRRLMTHCIDYGATLIGGGYVSATYAADVRFDYNLPNWSANTHLYTEGTFPTNAASNYNAPRAWGFKNYAQSQIIAYGPVSNSTLENQTEILINANIIRAGQNTTSPGISDARFNTNGKTNGARSSKYGLSEMGIDSGVVFADLTYHPESNGSPVGQERQNARHGQACCVLYTGKILDFKFRDIPGQMYYDSRWIGQAREYDGPEFEYRSYVQHIGHPTAALVLRPTVLGQTEYGSFSIANYSCDYPEETNSTNSELQTILRSSINTEYKFGTGGLSYDPIATARSNPGVDIEDPSSAWNLEENLINNDLNLRAELTEIGESNALYIKLNGTDLFPNGELESDYDIKTLSIAIRGVTLSAIDYHSLRFAIVDNAKTSVLFTSSNLAHREDSDVGSVPINSLTQSPVAGAYFCHFKTSTSEPHSYADIKDGYLKIWAELQ